MRMGRGVLVALLLAILSGCATNKAFVEGKRLIAEGNVESGLASLEQAVREDPGNIEVRAGLAREREAVVGRLLIEADNDRFLGDEAAAEQGYRRILGMDKRNERALAGLA